MSHGEIWTRIRLLRSLDAQDAASGINAALLGSRGTKQAVRKRFAELGVG